MITKVKISSTFECSLERAFKTAILCDLSKIHTGMGVMPKVTHTTDDNNWGIAGSSKNVHFEKSFLQKGGYGSVDRIIERNENKYWIIQVDSFQSWMLSFYKFVGKWETTQIAFNKIKIDYSYSLYSNNILLYPLNWIFGKIFWKRYMQQVLENIRDLIDKKEPYQFS